MHNYRAIFIILMCTVVLLACGDSTENNAPKAEVIQNTAEPVAANTAVAASNAAKPATQALAADTDAMKLGKEVYMRNCVACHQPNGKGIPPAFPSIAASEVVMGDQDAQILLILNGVPGSAMVAFGQQISDEEIAAVITYQRNSFGNNVGDEITAEQVKALR